MSAASRERVKQLVEAALQRGQGALSEFEAKTVLRQYGVAVPDGRLVTKAAEAVEVARLLGYPVVLKAVSAEVLHKTEAGLVELNVCDDKDVRRAYRRLKERGGAKISGILIERQLPREREFLVGFTRDPQFGPVVMFGLGGVLTEALDDVVFGIAPVSFAEALEMVSSIRSTRLLQEFRGWPAPDCAAFARIIQAVSQLALEQPNISEVDINPLLIDGGQPLAADALIVLTRQPMEAPSRPPVNTKNLEAVYYPRSVAIVGASNDPAKWGGTILTNLIAGGFPGPLYPVTAQATKVLGLPAYPSVTALPEAPDLAVVAVPAAAVRSVVDECGRKGVKAVVVVTAGFSEVGDQGRRLENEIAELAASYGMVLIGPNCMGVVSSRARLYAVGAVHLRPKPGPAGFVSQSGNVGVQLIVSAERRGGAIGSFVGVGNEALVHTADLLDFLRDDPNTDCVFAYIEGCDDGRRLLESARSLTREKPFIVLRAGVSEYGKRAAASHTGALAGSQRVFEAAARQAGMLLTTDPEEFLDLAMAFSYLPLPRGKRIAIVTMGGGWGVLSADEVARSGLHLAEFDENLLSTLDRFLPPYWSRGNPVDLVATLKSGAVEAVVEAIAASDCVDGLVVSGVVSVFGLVEGILAEARRLHDEGIIDLPEPSLAEPGLFAKRREHFMHHLMSLMERYEKPIVSVAAVPVRQSVFVGRGRYAVVVVQSPVRGVRVLAKMAEYAEWRGRLQSQAND